MRTFLAFLLLPISFAPANPPQPLTHDKAVMYLSDGIARLEGWRVEGSRVRLLNNPGAIICSHADIAQCDESGFAHFDSAALGWQALQQEVDYKIKTQRTIRRIASRWARAELYSLKLSQITGYGQDMVLP